MTLFVVAFLVIAALVLLLWLFMRPLADELPSLREEASASVFGAEDRARCSYDQADADASGSSLSAAEERQRRASEGIGSSVESG
jgi:hypothetical protein